MAGMTLTGENLSAVLGEILGCAYTAVSDTPAGAPARACVVPGQIIWDGCDCGLLAVTWRAIGSSLEFPAITEVSTPCPPLVAVQAGVDILRCATGLDNAGNPPSCEVLTAEAVQMTADAVAVRSAVACCLGELKDTYRIADFSLGATEPLGPEGACAGSALPFTLAFAPGGCCA